MERPIGGLETNGLTTPFEYDVHVAGNHDPRELEPDVPDGVVKEIEAERAECGTAQEPHQAKADRTPAIAGSEQVAHACALDSAAPLGRFETFRLGNAAPHPGQRPTHVAALVPQEEQEKTERALAMA